MDRKEILMKKKAIKYNLDELVYGIVCHDSVIATFENSIDRDDVRAFLQERYPDCDFIDVDL